MHGAKFLCWDHNHFLCLTKVGQCAFLVFQSYTICRSLLYSLSYDLAWRLFSIRLNVYSVPLKKYPVDMLGLVD